MTEARKSSWAVIGSLTAWLLTFATLIWNVAVKDANYSSRISAIETDIKELDTEQVNELIKDIVENNETETSS